MKTLAVVIMSVMFLCSCEKEPLTPTTQPQTTITGSNCTLVQCSAIAASTKSRCKRNTTNCNGRCFQHQ